MPKDKLKGGKGSDSTDPELKPISPKVTSEAPIPSLNKTVRTQGESKEESAFLATFLSMEALQTISERVASMLIKAIPETSKPVLIFDQEFDYANAVYCYSRIDSILDSIDSSLPSTKILEESQLDLSTILDTTKELVELFQSSFSSSRKPREVQLKNSAVVTAIMSAIMGRNTSIKFLSPRMLLDHESPIFKKLNRAVANLIQLQSSSPNNIQLLQSMLAEILTSADLKNATIIENINKLISDDEELFLVKTSIIHQGGEYLDNKKLFVFKKMFVVGGVSISYELIKPKGIIIDAGLVSSAATIKTDYETGYDGLVSKMKHLTDKI